jgi:hypothetical protein
MKLRVHPALRTATVAVALLAFGCGDGTGRAADKGGKNKLLPLLDEGISIVVEAESGVVEPSMVVEEVKPDTGLKGQEASGGRCVSVPKGANKACKKAKEDPKGKVTVTFTVPKAGTYYIYPRCWWFDQCGNSFGMLIDGKNPLARRGSAKARKPMTVTGTAYKAWNWIKFKALDNASTKARAFKLSKGKHTMTFTNREDDAKIDQIYITDDSTDVPQGVAGKKD